MEGNCKVSNIIYKAVVTTESEQNGDGHIYVGMASKDFKRRFYNHSKSFNDERKETSTELAKYIWALKRKGIRYKVKFEKVSHELPYRPELQKCSMCLKEKVEIIRNMKTNGAKCINKRWEIFRPCLHKNRYLLGTLDIRGNALFLTPPLQDFERRIQCELASGQTRSGRIWR